MDQVQPLSLIARLKVAADQWCTATGRTPGALSTLATNQGSFFDRLGSSRSGATIATLEKFAQVLVDPANWPDGAVPADVAKFAHDVGASAPAPAPSPDADEDSIGSEGRHGGIAPPAAPSGRAPGAAEEVALSSYPSAAPGDLFAAEAIRGAA